jgi:hypothetical protein
LLLAVVLLLLTSEAAGVWSSFLREMTPAGADLEDLALIPANARGFVSVRVADLWKSPAAQKAFADVRKRDPKSSDPTARMEKEFGLRPQEIERISVVSSDKGLVWVIVRTVKPYEERKILSRLKGAKQCVHRGRDYYRGADQQGREVAVWLASPRVVVAGPDEESRRASSWQQGALRRGFWKPSSPAARKNITSWRAWTARCSTPSRAIRSCRG